jgi:hypothetical protein
MAERTSSTASCVGFSMRNSAVMDTTPSCTLVVMCLRPCKGAKAFSSLRATSISSCEGATPGKLAVTVMVGTSRSGKFCTFMDPKAMKPATVSSTNSMTAGIGLRIDQEETLSMASLYLLAGVGAGASTRRTVSPWLRNAPPLATKRASAFKPLTTSTRSPLWRPVCTLIWLTFWSAPTV